MRTRTGRREKRRGAAAAELALVLPALAFLFVVGADFARLFYHYQTITNCARNGALYHCDPVAMAQSPYPGTQQAALADAPNLSPAPTVAAPRFGSDGNGPYVEVTVSYSFQTIANYPGIPGTIPLTRTVRMRVARVVPNFN